MKLETKQDAVCRYATTAGTAYSAMKGIFDTHGTAHSVRINGLADGRRYTYYVRCESVTGSGGTVNADDFAITFSVAAATGPAPNPTDPTDTTKPTVVVTTPLNGAKVTGMVNVKASATDKAGITSVTFLVDGTAIGTATASPYSIRWDTSDLTPGPYTIRAQARDGAGNMGTSRDVTVTVTASDDDRPETPTSGRAIFEPPEPDTGVLRYVLDIFRSGSDLTSPVATQNLGKPTTVDGEITADIARTLASLPAGTYVATVTAVGSTDKARSEPSPAFTVKPARPSSALMLSGADDSLAAAAPDVQPAAQVDSAEASAAWGSRSTLWVTDASASLVFALDATTGDVLATVPVGLRPMGLVAPRGVDKVYVADEGSDTISVISKGTMTVAATIPLPPPSGRQPHHLSASPDGRFVYVGERGSNVVNVIDTATDQVSARFAAGWPGSKTLAVVPDPTGELLYAVNLGTPPSRSTFTALDAGTGSVRWQLPIDDPGHFVLGPDGRSGVLSHGARSTITVIDLAGRTIGTSIDLGAGAGVDDLQLSADGRYLVATLRANGSVVIVDLTDSTSVSAVPLRAMAGQTAPSETEPLYVPVPDGGEFPAGVIMVDAATRRVVGRFRLPGEGTPHAAALDSRR